MRLLFPVLMGVIILIMIVLLKQFEENNPEERWFVNSMVAVMVATSVINLLVLYLVVSR